MRVVPLSHIETGLYFRQQAISCLKEKKTGSDRDAENVYVLSARSHRIANGNLWVYTNFCE